MGVDSLLKVRERHYKSNDGPIWPGGPQNAGQRKKRRKRQGSESSGMERTGTGMCMMCLGQCEQAEQGLSDSAHGDVSWPWRSHGAFWPRSIMIWPSCFRCKRQSFPMERHSSCWRPAAQSPGISQEPFVRNVKSSQKAENPGSSEQEQNPPVFIQPSHLQLRKQGQGQSGKGWCQCG